MPRSAPDLSSRRPLRPAGPLALVAAVSFLSLAGCVVPAGPEKDISGERIYQRHCARCHGPDGTGSKLMPSAKDLTNHSYMSARSDEQIERVIMAGRPPNMPAFGGQFGEPSMKVLVAYVRSLSDPSVVGATRPPEARGEAKPKPDGDRDQETTP